MASEVVDYGPPFIEPIRLPNQSLPHHEVAHASFQVATEDEKRLIAQRLHTDFLIEGGYATSSDLRDGLYSDEYSPNSTYFMVNTGSRIAACRCISAVGNEEGIGWLPTLKHFSINSQESEGPPGYGAYLKTLAPHEVIEVSALIATASTESGKDNKDVLDATHLLCSKVLRDSLENGHKLWVMNIQENLRRSLNIFLGIDQVQKIGDAAFYFRPDAIPCAVDPEKAVQSMLSSKSRLREYRLECLRATMSGVNERYLTDEMIQLFRDADIPTSPAQIGAASSSNKERTFGNLATKYTIFT